MFLERLTATSKISRPNTTLATVNMVLTLMVRIPSLPLDGRGAYFHSSRMVIPVVHSGYEQCKQELNVGTYNYIPWHESQTLILTG